MHLVSGKSDQPQTQNNKSIVQQRFDVKTKRKMFPRLFPVLHQMRNCKTVSALEICRPIAGFFLQEPLDLIFQQNHLGAYQPVGIDRRFYTV